MSVVIPTILSAGTIIDPTYELLSVDIVREVNRIPYAQLVLLDGDAARQKFEISDSDVFKPGQEIEIQLRYEGGDQPQSNITAFKGLVIGHALEWNARGSQLTVELKDASVKLTFARKSAVYQEQTDGEIIGEIITDGGLGKGEIQITNPKHREMVQYYCTDWDFMLARAEVNGLLVVVENGIISLQKIELDGAPKQSFIYGLSEIYNFEIEANVSHQYGVVQSIAWDLKKQKPSQAAIANSFSLPQGNLNIESITRAIGIPAYQLSSPVPLNPRELQGWADSTLAMSRLDFIRGRVAVPGLGSIKLMDLIEIEGIGKHFNGKALVTGLRHRIDHQGWQTDLQFGLSSQRYAQRPDIMDRPAAGLLPGVNGLQIGIVDELEDDPEKEFQVRVNLPGIDENKGAVWARLASPNAGKSHGFFFPPEKGDEVIVGFFNDDPRQAVILGAMYSSKNSPPGAVGQLKKDNPQKAIITKKEATILFDDEKEAIKVSDKHGNSITLNKDGIEIKSAKNLTIDAGGKIEVKGQADLAINANGNVEIKGTKIDLK
jgi:Rhs element Vgr protein